MLTNFLADSPLFGLDYTRDYKNSSSMNLLMIYQPNLRLPGHLYNKESAMFWPIIKYLENYYLMVNTNSQQSLRYCDLESPRVLKKGPLGASI